MAVKIPVIHVLIPTHNRVESLRRVMEALRGQSYPAVRAYVIDCGSNDGTREMLDKEFKGAMALNVINVRESVWWTEAMNLAVTKVLSGCDDNDFILSMNDDAVFRTADGLSRLVDSQRKMGKSIVIPLCREQEDGGVISSGCVIDWAYARRTGSCYLLAMMGESRWPDHLELDVLYGRGALIPAQVFRDIGNYNYKDFPHYGGDSELSVRARKAGWRGFVDCGVRVDTVFGTTGGSDILSQGKASLVSALVSAFKVIISDRSPYQIRKGFMFIDRCCPKKYRLKNKIAWLSTSLKYFNAEFSKFKGIGYC